VNVRQLEVFWAIMRTGSVTGASKLLAISQPAVSKMLRHTEDQMKIQLFVRRNGKVFPTEKALQLYKFADDIFSSMETMKQAIFDIRDTEISRIQIVTVPTIAESILPRPIAAMLAKYPRTKVSLKLLPVAQIINRIALRQADVGIIFGPCDDPSVVQEELFFAKAVCAINQANPVSLCPAIGPADLAGERLISYHRYTPWGARIWPILENAGCNMDRVIECNHATAAFALVNEGAGIAVLPTVPSDTLSFSEVRVRRLSVDIPFTALLLFAGVNTKSRITRVFVDCLRADLAASGLQMPPGHRGDN